MEKTSHLDTLFSHRHRPGSHQSSHVFGHSVQKGSSSQRLRRFLVLKFDGSDGNSDENGNGNLKLIVMNLSAQIRMLLLIVNSSEIFTCHRIALL